MIQCIFIYNAGAGNVQFTPTYPPIGKQPNDGLAATRHDSITSSGIKQAVLERIDDVTTLTFPYVPQTDLAAWKAMMTWLLAGNVFAYRPNANFKAALAAYTSGNIIVQVVIQGYPRVFTNYADSISGHYPWVVSVDNLDL